jgi:hypothetical protein
MFTLRETHNQAFQAKAEADFVREVMQYLRENHAETIVKLPNGEVKVVDLPETTLQKMVEGGLLQAKDQRLTWKNTIRTFIEYMFFYSPNFWQHSIVRNIWTNSIYTSPDLIFDEIIEIKNKSEWLSIKKEIFDFF